MSQAPALPLIGRRHRRSFDRFLPIPFPPLPVPKTGKSHQLNLGAESLFASPAPQRYNSPINVNKRLIPPSFSLLIGPSRHKVIISE
jgi:hypothetical protein